MLTVTKIAELSGHQHPVFTVEGSQKPGIIFTGGNDRGVVEWSLKRMEFIKVMHPVKSSVYALHATTEKPFLVSGERSGEASIFDFSEQKIVARLNKHLLPVFDIQSVASKNELLLASEDGTVSVWNMDSFGLVYSFPVSSDTVRVMALSPSGKWIAFGCKDNFIRVYSLDDYSAVTVLGGHTLPVTSLRFSPDGARLISGSRDAQIKVWDTADFTEIQSIPAHLFAVYDLRFHPTLPLMASASRDKTIKIWSTADFRLLKTISREKGYSSHSLSVNKLFWEPWENRLISVGDDKLVMIWEISADGPAPL